MSDERTSGGVSEARKRELSRMLPIDGADSEFEGWTLLRWLRRMEDWMKDEGITPPLVGELRALLSSAPAEAADRQDEIEAATAALLIELAFLVPKGTDMRAAIGPALMRFKKAVEAPQRRPAGDGVARIAAERQRQIEREGWSPGHDDEHQHGQLREAAICYANATEYARAGEPEERWPWDPEWWKPKDEIRNLERAGALIAAEIDRLLRHGIAAAGETQKGAG